MQNGKLLPTGISFPIDNEFCYRLPTATMIVEGEIPIEEVADDASNDIVGG